MSNVKIQISNECQSLKLDSEIEDSELVLGPKDFGISFELWI
jgi:hypothetical protein